MGIKEKEKNKEGKSTREGVVKKKKKKKHPLVIYYVYMHVYIGIPNQSVKRVRDRIQKTVCEFVRERMRIYLYFFFFDCVTIFLFI